MDAGTVAGDMVGRVGNNGWAYGGERGDTWGQRDNFDKRIQWDQRDKGDKRDKFNQRDDK